MPAFVEGRILYDEGKYEEALPAFERPWQRRESQVRHRFPELHFYAGETLCGWTARRRPKRNS